MGGPSGLDAAMCEACHGYGRSFLPPDNPAPGAKAVPLTCWRCRGAGARTYLEARIRQAARPEFRAEMLDPEPFKVAA